MKSKIFKPIPIAKAFSSLTNINYKEFLEIDNKIYFRTSLIAPNGWYKILEINWENRTIYKFSCQLKISQGEYLFTSTCGEDISFEELDYINNYLSIAYNTKETEQ